MNVKIYTAFMNELSISEINSLWRKVLNTLKSELDDKRAYDAFFKDTYIYSLDDNEIIICCDSNLSSSILQSKYQNLIISALPFQTNESYKIKFITNEEIEEKHSTNAVYKSFEKPLFFTKNRLEPRYNFENYVVGTSNKEACEASKIVAKNLGTKYNPLFIYSQSGLGKTHLLNAIGNYVLENNPNKKVLYCSSQEFIDEYIKFVSSDKNDENLKDFISSFDVFLVDDVQMLQDKTKTEEFFFSIFEILMKSGKQIVLTCDRLPNELNGLDKRLVTRFLKGLTVSIQPPSQELCENILRRKIQDSELKDKIIDDDVIEFMSSKFKSSIRNLEGALLRLTFYCSINETSHIDLVFASDALSSLIDTKNKKQKISVQKILNIVSSYYSISVEQLTGKSKTNNVVNARHVAIYLIREELDLPLKQIGQQFSNRDHATVIHSITKVEESLKTDTQLSTAIEELKKQIKVS